MSEQPEALRLADGLKQRSDWYEFDPSAWCPAASAELRRLHALCEEMGEALEELSAEEWRDDFDPVLDKARTRARSAIAKWKESK